MKFTVKQRYILGFLSALVVCLIVSAAMLIYFTDVLEQTVDISNSSTEKSILSVSDPTHVLTPTLPIIDTPTINAMPGIVSSPYSSIPTEMKKTPFYVFTPTQVFYPSVTPIPRLMKKPTSTIISNPTSSSSSKPQNTKPASNGNCTAQLNYAKANHQYKLSSIKAIYQPMIDFYQSIIDQAIRERDAKTILEYQRKLESEKNEMNNAIQAENQRYKGEVAYIKATC